MFNFFSKKRKVLVIGLDCAAPELIFQRWKKDLPNLSWLAEQGIWGELDSSIPAITVPAWSSMLSSKDPGVLGFYGFRNRRDYSYNGMFIATGEAVKEKRVWDYVGEAGLKSVVIGAPQTYPVKPLNGHLISDLLTPNLQSNFTYPYAFKREVLSIEPEYEFDVREFRTEDKDWLLEQIYRMTKKRFAIVDYALKNKPWDFFMVMEIALDRIHHGFWHFHDPEHINYTPGNPYKNTIRDYYIFIDQKIGEWLEQLKKDTCVLVVSDHGAKRLDGGICLNEWLWRNGYLRFKEEPVPGNIVTFEKMKVDWDNTKAWGSGGYYGSVFLNVKGREPNGIILPEQYEDVRDELSEKFRTLAGPGGNNFQTEVFKPQEIYRQVNGVAPDLIVYFGDLNWRSVESLGHQNWYTFENDSGPDTCNHAQNGMFILYDPANFCNHQEIKGANLMDIAPTILNLMGLKVPPHMQGQLLNK